MTGIVKWFNDAKGYGFISSKNKDNIFVHYTNITIDGFKTLCEDQVVEFDLYEGPKGLEAKNVRKNT